MRPSAPTACVTSRGAGTSAWRAGTRSHGWCCQLHVPYHISFIFIIAKCNEMRLNGRLVHGQAPAPHARAAPDGLRPAREDRRCVHAQVRKALSSLRNWADLSLLQLSSHGSARANLHRLGQPTSNTFLAPGRRPRAPPRARRRPRPRWDPAPATRARRARAAGTLPSPAPSQCHRCRRARPASPPTPAATGRTPTRRPAAATARASRAAVPTAPPRRAVPRSRSTTQSRWGAAPGRRSYQPSCRSCQRAWLR